MTAQPTTEPTNHPTNQPAAQGDQMVVGGRVAEWSGRLFYTVVAGVALAGQTGAAVHWLHWSTIAAVPAVGALELGGIALAARSDYRRRLGERAVAARALSTAVAVFAVVFNWLGHGSHLQGGFFAGMSALGYAVWLINAGDRRRDQLRKDGKLAQVAPAYGLAQWLRHPWLTRRARALAVEFPALGLYGSLAKAAADLRTERRQAAITELLGRRLAEGRDPLAADIAVTVYDLDRIATALADRADYDRLTDLLAVDLDPVSMVEPPSDPVPVEAEQEPTGGATGDRRPARKRTNRPVTQPVDRARLHVVGEPAAVANARLLREKFGDQLPPTERQIRSATGWSKVRVEKAVEAYRAGADRQADDQEQEATA